MGAVLARGAVRFLELLPALLLALICARAIELAIGGPPPSVMALALGLDLLALARGLPLLFLLSLPLLLVEAPRLRMVLTGVLWTVLMLLHVVLMQYALTTRVPLGADLYGYSSAEVAFTLKAGASIGLVPFLHLAVPVACLWGGLVMLIDSDWSLPAPVAAGVLGAGVLALLLGPGQGAIADKLRTDAIALDKSAYLVEDTVAWLVRSRSPAAPAPEPAPASMSVPAAGAASAPGATTPADPRYPFLHAEQTQDVLGPLFSQGDAKPNLVFVIVEGLGRSFSGPGAAHGSFTPFLDALAERSLYFENFLANQGRTFAALPTIFGALPFGDAGFAATADKKSLPEHVTLLSILQAQGYHTRFYAGFDLAFDNERPFLSRQGVESMVDVHDFPGLAPANTWGYSDGEVVDRLLAAESAGLPGPSVVVLQTVTMHTPYTFPGQAAYAARLEKRLDELGVPSADREPYRRDSKIYTSVLYADDAIRTLVEGLSKGAAWANTILVITGDHLLPELPMATRIERYHVPLIIHSPLLRSPAHVKAVSSQMDLAPSLLAYLAHAHGLRTPGQVTWLGTGLDLSPRFRNVHDVPLKLGKHMLADFVQGSWYFSRGQLFRLSDGMGEEAASDADAAERLQQAFAKFAAANDRFVATGELMPSSAMPEWIAYQEGGRAAVGAGEPEPAETAALSVAAVRAPAEAKAGALDIEADFSNPDARSSRTFLPLVVLLDEAGRELSETYGKTVSLAPGAGATVSLTVKSAKLKPGRYYFAVIPSDPLTGKAIGLGKYRIPVRIH